MTKSNQNPLITIHSVLALKKREYSIVVANIPNTDENLEKISKQYPKEDFFLEFHFTRKDMRWVIPY
jgi:hypothetical protein